MGGPITAIRSEPQYEETFLQTYWPNEDSNQPAHPRSLIRVFVVRNFASLAMQNASSDDSDQPPRMI